MKLVSPVLFRYHKEFTCSFPWEEAVFAFRIVPVMKIGGTVITTTWRVQWLWRGREYQLSFTWRPSVTRRFLKEKS